MPLTDRRLLLGLVRRQQKRPGHTGSRDNTEAKRGERLAPRRSDDGGRRNEAEAGIRHE
jgi:hypothetical protein